jgi:hypothetical protein
VRVEGPTLNAGDFRWGKSDTEELDWLGVLKAVGRWGNLVTFKVRSSHTLKVRERSGVQVVFEPKQEGED